MTSVCFYNGVVRHRRLNDPLHALNYNVSYILADLDRVDDAKGKSFFFRAGAISFNPKDHGDGKTSDLARWVRSMLKQQGVEEEAAKIELFTMPRVFGFVFNPISIYFVSDGEGRLHHILYEVNNTFGGRHFYLVKAYPDGRVQKHRCDKAFYVSPFFDVGGYYDFRTAAPDRDFYLGIAYRDNDAIPKLFAAVSAKQATVSNWSCFKILLRFPLMTVGVVAAIHWHALRLFVKGARFKSAHGCERAFGAVSKGSSQGNNKNTPISEAA